MRFRKLRIAWSVMFAIATVLLIGLWVQSYWVQYRVVYPRVGPGVTEFDSAAGVVWIQQSYWLSVIKWPRSLYQFKVEGGYLSFVSDLRKKTCLGFARFEDMGGMARTTIFPHWFPVLLLAGVAYVPWLPWSNRFGLRTLLLATTLVAVALGLILWALRH